ncbi:MAG TPA: CAP domain-containing protein, partial [Gemmataceae bacterium]|nr:CAP domain-containing protein [Gemmataceae bacterium]
DAKDGTWSQQVTHGAPANPPAKSGLEALAEVNALRAQRGLPGYVFDEGLTKAAEECAKYRASYLISGHTSNDFAFVPPGNSASAAGCAAWHPSMGWGSCCCYDRYTYAGAGWSMGRDGRRYMHLYVR